MRALKNHMFPEMCNALIVYVLILATPVQDKTTMYNLRGSDFPVNYTNPVIKCINVY